MKLVSACLLGINCKYNGKNNKNKKVMMLAKKEVLIPVCPEQLGGLPTPRERAQKIGKKIISETGKNLTKKFRKGTKETLKIAKLLKIKQAILKQGSPSCGCNLIPDGTFSGNKIKGEGETAKILRINKIKLITEEEL